jgi:DNA-binding Lrp family transcriptional regulator
MLDRFDVDLLNLLQRDASKTAERLSERVPLSPSAIARRLRRLKSSGWIERVIALLPQRLREHRLQALTFITLNEHADLAGKTALRERLVAAPQVQFCYETTGAFDLLALFDCGSMDEFNELADGILSADRTVRRYETSFVKREVKFAPFVQLARGDVAG